MNVEKAKGLLYKVVDLIKEPEIKRFTSSALDQVLSEFFVVPSSSSGKYHPPENNINGGLVVHTVKVVLFGYDYAQHLDSFQRDEIVSACLLHDTLKGMENGIDGEWKGYAKDHALLAYNWINRFKLDKKSKDKIRNGVRTHMSVLSHSEKERINALKKNLPLYQRIVQMADISASRSWASFIPGINILNLIKLDGLRKRGESDEKYNKRIYEIVDDLILTGLEKAIDKLYKGNSYG